MTYDFTRLNHLRLFSAAPNTASFEAVFEIENKKLGKSRLSKGLHEWALRHSGARTFRLYNAAAYG